MIKLVVTLEHKSSEPKEIVKEQLSILTNNVSRQVETDHLGEVSIDSLVKSNGLYHAEFLINDKNKERESKPLIDDYIGELIATKAKLEIVAVSVEGGEYGKNNKSGL